ncbi:MAG: GGDEF domain-containing protein [Acidiferrobacterales bacterium]
MSIDLHTMMLMISVLTLLLSGLLALVGFHSASTHGVWLWALASLCYSAASFIGSTLPTATSSSWLIVLLVVFFLAGSGLQFSGIQAFTEKCVDWRIPLLVAGTGFAESAWFTIINPNPNARAIVSTLVFSLINAICARALLIRIEQPQRTGYWFTGASFSMISATSLTRAVMILQTSPDPSTGLSAELPIVHARFFVSSLLQICVAFGFILMINYRLITDVQKIASRDALTGAPNRRSLEEEAGRLSARCARARDVLTILLIDVDHFKSVNDQLGHQAGDKLLQRLADTAHACIRSDDYFARYGGDEFCILLPSSTEEGADILANRLCQAYAALNIDFGGKALHSTISIGIADSNHAGLELHALIAAADKALYRAKQEGRGRVMLHSKC